MPIIDQIRGRVSEYFAQHAVETVFRDQDRALWSVSLEQLSYIPSFYCHAVLDFFQCCQQDSMGRVVDISMVLRDKQQNIYAVWPLTLAVFHDRFTLSSFGQPVCTPLFNATVSLKKQKQLSAQCFELCQQLAQAYKIQQWRLTEVPYPDKQSLSVWYQTAMNAGGRTQVQHELFVDLELSIAEIRQHFRKSYRSLISQGLKLWQVAVMDKADEEIWRQFHALYVRVAGKDVRSERVWDLQYQAVAEGQAVLVYLTDSQGVMVGGGYFNLSRDECVYTIAAYDRALFDKPLGHAVQFRLIELMKARGLKWYKIGPIVYPQDAPTDKELSIAHFKQGFATHCCPRFLVDFMKP